MGCENHSKCIPNESGMSGKSPLQQIVFESTICPHSAEEPQNNTLNLTGYSIH